MQRECFILQIVPPKTSERAPGLVIIQEYDNLGWPDPIFIQRHFLYYFAV